MPFYGTVLGKRKITLCFASYPSRVGNWGVPQFALPIARRSWQTVCQNIPWPFKHTLHQKHGMLQSVTNAGESQWAFDYPAVKPVVWSGNIWIRNKRVSQQARALPLTVAGLAALDGDEDHRMKAWIWVCSSQSYGFWRSGLQRTNTFKIVSFRNYVVVLLFL